MTDPAIAARLDFLREAERLKDTLRSAHTASGRRESVAEHSWRLALLAMTFADAWPELDTLKLMKLCILHDLGEAISGDVPAPLQDPDAPKHAEERRDFVTLIAPLPAAVRSEFLALWDEYTAALTPEARVAKALDKLETLLQHVQGANPPDFDYRFNLSYARSATDAVPLAARIRELLDTETARRMNGDA